MQAVTLCRACSTLLPHTCIGEDHHGSSSHLLPKPRLTHNRGLTPVTLLWQAAVTTCSMATCSMVLLSVLKTAGSLVSEREEAAFMAKCHQFAVRYSSTQSCHLADRILLHLRCYVMQLS